jgi:multidrug efflux pump subunit AcrA (membrane-fusion protein)
VRERELNRAGWVALLAVYVLAAGCGGIQHTSPMPSPVAISLQLVTSGLATPLDLEQPNDGSGRLFIVEQGGTIKILQNGALLQQPFLNISNKVIFQGEMG